MVLLGQFHTELALLRSLMYFIEGSGIEEVLVKSDVLSKDGAARFLDVRLPVSEMRPVLEALLLGLFKLAIEEFKSSNTENDFWQWRRDVTSESTMAAFYFAVMHVIALTFNYVDAIREQNVDRLIRMTHLCLPVFYASNCHNYLKWTSVQLCYFLMWRGNEKCMMALRKSFCRMHPTNPRNAVSLDQATEMTLKDIAVGSEVGISKERLKKLVIAKPCVRLLLRVLEEKLELSKRHYASLESASPSDYSGKKKLHYFYDA